MRILACIHVTLGIATVAASAHAQIDFAANRFVLTGEAPVDLLAVDLDGDGHQDLVTANYGDYEEQVGSVSVLLGNGRGDFEPHRDFPVLGSQVRTLIATDVDRNGHVDLLVVSYGAIGAASGVISLLRGLPGGQLGVPEAIATGASFSSVSNADVNEDGWPDLVAAADSSDVLVIRNDGSGSFLPPTTLIVGPGTIVVRAGDFDEDGHVDLACANRGVYPSYFGSLSVLRGDGTGAFGPREDIYSGPVVWELFVDDVDADGHLDLLARNRYTQNWNFLSVEAVFGGGPAGFSAPVTVFSTYSFSARVHLARLDSDDLPDLVFIEWSGVGIRQNTGQRGFELHEFIVQPHALAQSPTLSAASADWNEDGLPDLALPRGGDPARDFDREDAIHLLFGNGTGRFPEAPTQFLLHGIGSSSAIGDLDADGHLDLVVGGYGIGTSGVAVALGDGRGGFGEARWRALAADRVQFIADVDGDGLRDVVTTNEGRRTGTRNGHVSILFGSGGTSPDRVRSYPVAPTSIVAELHDANGDGIQDLVVLKDGEPPDGPVVPHLAGVQVLPGIGGGEFGPAILTEFVYHPRTFAAGEFDEDGILDFVVEGGECGRWVPALNLYRGRGDGTFYFTGPVCASDSVSALAARDVDRDGHLDVVAILGGRLGVYFGDGNGGLPRLRRFSVGVYPGNGLHFADLDRDGLEDLVTGTLDGPVALAGDGAGEFASPRGFRAVGGEYELARYLGGVGDIDEDGLLDLVTVSQNGYVTVLRNRSFTCNARKCLRGNVNVTAGGAEAVLRINGESGDERGVATLAPREPITVSLATSTAGPRAARYALWVWSGLEIVPIDLRVGGGIVGCLVNPSPAHAGHLPQPTGCRVVGLPLGPCSTGNAPAPMTIRRQRGVGRGASFTIQGVIEDRGSSSPIGLSVTNALRVRVP